MSSAVNHKLVFGWDSSLFPVNFERNDENFSNSKNGLMEVKRVIPNQKAFMRVERL